MLVRKFSFPSTGFARQTQIKPVGSVAQATFMSPALAECKTIDHTLSTECITF